jgi:DNA-binding CsgD family transcriptional regulator
MTNAQNLTRHVSSPTKIVISSCGAELVVDVEAHDAVISRLYEAAATPALWPSAMAAFADATQSVEANLIVSAEQSGPKPAFTPVSGVVGRLFRPEQVKAYLNYYGRLDPLTPLLNKAPAGSLVLSHEHISDEYVTRSEYHQDFMLPAGSRHSASWKLEDVGARTVRVTLHNWKKPFVREQVEPWAPVARHASWAVRLSLQLFAATAREAHFRQAVGLAGVACLMVDADARLLDCAGPAATLLEGGPFKLSYGQILTTGSAAESKRLRELTARTASGRGAGVIRIANVRGGYWLVRAVPAGVRSDNPFDPRRAGCVLLFVTTPDVCRTPEPSLIRLALGSTQAEAEVAALLVAGATPARIAAERLVSLTTVRTQIRALLEHSGLNRVGELVRLLADLR